jgi:O-antigen ligase
VANADVASVFLCLTLALPWLNPFAFGPTPPAVQWLVTGFCVAAGSLVLAWRTNLAALPCVAAQSWLLAGLVSCALGIMQFLGLANDLAPWVNQTQAGEAFANLRQRNQFASMANIGLAALLCHMACQTPQPTKALNLYSHGQWARFCAAILFGAGIAASSSRTGLAQLLALTLVNWVWGQAQTVSTKRILIAVWVSYLVATLLLPMLAGAGFGNAGILSRLDIATAPCTSRLTLWTNVLNLITLKPLWGWGWGELDYAHFITLYPGGPNERFCDILDNAHNLPLHLSVELGLPTAIMVCGLFAWLTLRAQPWAEKNVTRQLAWSVLLAISLHSLLEYPLWYGPFQLAAVLSLTILWITPRQPSSKSACESDRTSNADRSLSRTAVFRAGLAGLATALLAAVAYVSWDYHRISQIYLTPSDRSARYRDNTLEKIRSSWVFHGQVQFAELTITPLTPENAAVINAQARSIMHFSPEAKVVEKVIQSARMLDLEDEAQYYELRYRAAFPVAYQRWRQSNH